MNDWLSEIENRLEGYGSIKGNLALMEKARMARVIRELVEGLQILKELTLDNQVVNMWTFFDNLSPDAKELLK